MNVCFSKLFNFMNPKEDDMKKLLAVLVVLSLATVANAGLVIGVNGVADAPDSSVILTQSDTAMISVVAVGVEFADAPAFLYISGPATLDITNAINNVTGAAVEIWTDFPQAGDQVFLDFTLPAIGAVIALTPAAADGILLHCEGIGDVTLALYMDRTANVGGTFQLMDTQVIHQIIPEPMTMGLLGLGGLFLRRRK
jgi:hypothetical protein